MGSATERKMYCADCNGATDHVKVSYFDTESVRKVWEAYWEKHPDKWRGAVVRSYPKWLQSATWGIGSVATGLINGVSYHVLGKEYASIWVCSNCKRPQDRVFE